MNKYGTQYLVLTDINGPENRPVWTLTREQVDAIVRLLMEHGNDEMENLGVSIGRALRAMLDTVETGAKL
jgi:hypothetical protein